MWLRLNPGTDVGVLKTGTDTGGLVVESLASDVGAEGGPCGGPG